MEKKNQINTKTYIDLKYKHSQKELQMIQNFPQFISQAYANVKCILQAYVIFFLFFQLQRNSTTYTMGRGSTPPWHKQHNKLITTSAM
jgi:hypothetical protein